MRVPSRETPNHPLVIWTRRGEHGEEALARSSSTDTKSVSNTYAQSSTYPRAAFHPSENCTIFRGKSCIFPTVTRKLDERGGFLVSKTLSLSSFFEKNFNIETMDNLSPPAPLVVPIFANFTTFAILKGRFSHRLGYSAPLCLSTCARR